MAELGFYVLLARRQPAFHKTHAITHMRHVLYPPPGTPWTSCNINSGQCLGAGIARQSSLRREDHLKLSGSSLPLNTVCGWRGGYL